MKSGKHIPQAWKGWPWVDGGNEDAAEDEQEPAGVLRSQRREARTMRATAAKSGSDAVRPEDLNATMGCRRNGSGCWTGRREPKMRDAALCSN
jgi:hypothetical protein